MVRTAKRIVVAWTMVLAGASSRWLVVAAVGASLAALSKGPVGLALPALVWSRLILKRHTPLEVALGTVIGAVAGAAMLYL